MSSFVSYMPRRILLALALAFVLLSSVVDAHGWMSKPTPRGKYIGKYDYEEIAPATTNPLDSNFVCRSAPAYDQASWTSLKAGESVEISVNITAAHQGGCFVYLSYDGDKPQGEMQWFKIWDQPNCRSSSMKGGAYKVPIPDWLPSGEHVVMRWEWYGLHLYSDANNAVEFYAQCVDAKLSGKGSNFPQPGKYGSFPIPGHMPTVAQGAYWAWNKGGGECLSGPRVATQNGAAPAVERCYCDQRDSAACKLVGADGSSATVAPTVAATVAPTVAATVPPTVKATVPPTVAATVTPTVAATVAPSVSATTKPTNPPQTAATTKPTSAPAGQCSVVFEQRLADSWSSTGRFEVRVTPAANIKDLKFRISPAPLSFYGLIQNVNTGLFQLPQYFYDSAGVLAAGQTSQSFGFNLPTTSAATITVEGNPCV